MLTPEELTPAVKQFGMSNYLKYWCLSIFDDIIGNCCVTHCLLDYLQRGIELHLVALRDRAEGKLCSIIKGNLSWYKKDENVDDLVEICLPREQKKLYTHLK